MTLLRPANAEDLGFLLAAEAAASKAGFVSANSREEHLAAMSSPDAAYFVIGDCQGYAIFLGLQSPHHALELKRVVITAPGQGLGRRAFQELLRYAFVERKAHRLFFDAFDDNARALHLYRGLGFREEGILREAALRQDGYRNLVLFSMLAAEYETWTRAPATGRSR
ncbi:MAG: GNAT family N-acetyltransferase [Bryobacteraceae bacterium]|nr:GNAT family N-acetyltransferase [Bryobacteraceae bacterium]